MPRKGILLLIETQEQQEEALAYTGDGFNLQERFGTVAPLRLS